METQVKNSSVDIIDNRIAPNEPEEFITVPFDYFITDSLTNWSGKTALVMRFSNPYDNKDIQLSDPAIGPMVTVEDENSLEGYAELTVKQYLEYNTNIE